jgi:hypothetical protein
MRMKQSKGIVGAVQRASPIVIEDLSSDRAVPGFVGLGCTPAQRYHPTLLLQGNPFAPQI